MEYLGQFSTFIAFAAFQQGTFEFNADHSASSSLEFLKFLLTNAHSKVAQIFGDFWAILKPNHFYLSNI